MHDVASPRSEGSITFGAFARWLLAATCIAVFAIGAVNWYVDPTGVTGRVTPWRIAENAEVRSVKLDLFEAQPSPPEVMLYGSSRTMKFDPRDVTQLTGERAFNAAVSGGIPRDAWLFTHLLAEGPRAEFPHLVWGLDVDAFRNKQLRAGLSTDPRMQRFIPRTERFATTIATAGTLTELQTLKATARSIRIGGSDGVEAGDELDRPFSADGFQEWSLPFPRKPIYLERAVRKQIAQYAGFIFERDAYTGIEEAPLQEFQDVIRIANEHGDVPTIFLTPYHPLAEELLAKYEIDARTREVRTQLRELQQDGELQFELVDLTDLASFDGDPAEFYDGVHMTPANTALVLKRLQRDQLLARADTRLKQ